MHSSAGLLACLAVLIIFIYRYQSRPRILRHGRPLPRPPQTLPLLGNGLHFLAPRQKLFPWFVGNTHLFGLNTYEISVPSLPPGVVVQDPRVLEYVLRNEDAITKGEFFRQRSWDLFGHGIINAHGSLWRAQRKAGLKFFSGNSLEDFVNVVLPAAYAKTQARLRESAEKQQKVDLQDVFLDLTTRAVGRMAYHMDIDSRSPFSTSFDYASDRIGLRFQNPLYRVTEPLVDLFLYGGRFRKALREVKDFGLEIVRNAKTRRNAVASPTPSSPPAKSDHGEDGAVECGRLIDDLLAIFPDEPQVVADAALNFLSAGRDTTAQSLTWTFYHLMRNPQAMDLLCEELRSAMFPIGSVEEQQEQQPQSREKLRLSDLAPTNLSYVTAVLYESLRLHPPVPFELKQCEAAVELPDGTMLPRGAIVVWCTWAMNRSPALWGASISSSSIEPVHNTYNDDLEAFRPERWLTCDESRHDGRRFEPRSAYTFPVFNAGPRACLGRRMAEVLALWVLCRLCREFVFEQVGEERERETQNSLTLPMKGGLPVHVHLVRRRRRSKGGGEAAE